MQLLVDDPRIGIDLAVQGEVRHEFTGIAVHINSVEEVEDAVEPT